MAITPRLLDVKVPWAQIEPTERQPVNCLICGSYNAEPMYSLVINNEEFHLVRCPNDNLIWLNPQPGLTFLKTLYSEAYYQVDKYDKGLLPQVGIRDVSEEDQEYRKKTARNQVREWQEAGIFPTDTETGQRRRLLEVGGGRGYLQQMAEEAGWETLGLEISKYGIKEGIKKKLKILPVMLEDIRDYIPSPGYFNLVAMYDFIEHATDPGKVIRSLRDILNEGQEGYLAIRTPNADEEKGPRLHLIDHLWHFSAGTLEALLQKEGFTVVKRFGSGIFPPEAKETEDRIVNMTVFAKKK